MEFVPLFALPLLVKKGVDFVRYLTNGDRNGYVTQLVAWAFGVAAVMLYAHANWAVPVGGATLDRLNVWSQIAVGLNLGSIGSFAQDLLKAVDNHNTAKIPTLLPAGPTPPTQDVG